MMEVHGVKIEGNRLVLTVTCEGHEHTATIEGGKLRLDNHDEDTLDAFTTFGAKEPPCYELLQMWRRDPVALLRVLELLPPEPDGVYPYLDASNAHITEKDSQLLEKLADGDFILSREYGWWYYVSIELPEDQEQELREYGFSEAFIKLMWYAVAHDCHWILLDNEGATIDDLPLHEW
jgi:hypothetical protein